MVDKTGTNEGILEDNNPLFYARINELTEIERLVTSLFFSKAQAKNSSEAQLQFSVESQSALRGLSVEEFKIAKVFHSFFSSSRKMIRERLNLMTIKIPDLCAKFVEEESLSDLEIKGGEQASEYLGKLDDIIETFSFLEKMDLSRVGAKNLYHLEKGYYEQIGKDLTESFELMASLDISPQTLIEKALKLQEGKLEQLGVKMEGKGALMGILKALEANE
jgi:hypothetical protein